MSRQHPLQNRVTPFGDLVAVPARGMFTGNRGIIHDPATRTLTGRGWTTKAWITCTCEWKGIRRDVWARRSWTELFFLDEATALSAGHRPCFTCRGADAVAFRVAWALGNHIAAPTAPEMDTVLHRERLDGRSKRFHPVPRELPDGAIVVAGSTAWLVAAGTTWRWSTAGYERAGMPKPEALLTPPSVIAALGAGYRPALHPSAC